MSSNELVPSERLLYDCAVITCSLALKTELKKREDRACHLWISHRRARHQRKPLVLALSS